MQLYFLGSSSSSAGLMDLGPFLSEKIEGPQIFMENNGPKSIFGSFEPNSVHFFQENLNFIVARGSKSGAKIRRLLTLRK